MNNDYNTIGLYEHNAESYTKVSEAFKEENIVGIVHATGTGKSYNALQLAFDNKDKKIIYVAPSNGIIEHIKEIIEENPNLDFIRDFSHIEFRTYQSFINMSRKELSDLDVDMLIVDEFHHLGAPVWGGRIEDIIKTHPNIKVFGMTAYTVRDRGTSYERDMANPETNEIFSNKIASRYDICDAMIDGVLPKPIYKSAYVKLEDTAEKLEEKLEKMDHNSKDYIECKKILSDIRKRIHEAPSISDVVKKNIKPNGKYIYFCPPNSQDEVNNIDTIMSEAKKWFLEMGLSEETIVFYKTTSDMGLQGKENRNAFYNDKDLNGNSSGGKLRVMFAINQYNEGVHAPNLDGVIMGRGTSSDIVYFEQLGRALSVRGETKKKFEELEKYSIEELLSMCQKRDIPIKENTPKEEIIEKFIAPTIIDLTNNYEFIKQLENNLQDRVKGIQSKGLGNKRIIKIKDYSFDIEMVNQELFETLRYVMDRLTLTWEDKYELAKSYYEKHGNLSIPQNFKTTNGYEYDENGVVLGKWLSLQRNRFNIISKDKQEKLLEIEISIKTNESQWNNMYKLANIYYKKHKNLLVPQGFKTINGYEYNEKGKNLGLWISNQRSTFKNLSEEKKKKLLNIDFVLNAFETKWDNMYKLAKAYYEHFGDLLVPQDFKTKNGYEYDETGVDLGNWISHERTYFKKRNQYTQKKLLKIGFVVNTLDDKWEKMYKLANIYYKKHKNLLIPFYFKTINGYEYDENGEKLGTWINTQRTTFENLSKEKKKKLLEIGFVSKPFDEKWEKTYNLAKIYFEHYNNLLIPKRFKTKNGYEYDKDGISLGEWILHERKKFEKRSKENQKKLLEIGFVLNVNDENWKKMYELAEIYFSHHKNLLISQKFKTINGYEYDENGSNLGMWINNQRSKFEELTKERQEKLIKIGFVKNIKNNEEEIKQICLNNNINIELNKNVLSKITIQEFIAKINFLKENNIELTNNKGKLHDLFSMSSPNMKVIFKLNLEEIIDTYYINKKEKGV